MNRPFRKGFRLAFLFTLLLALISSNSPAGVSGASETDTNNSGLPAGSGDQIIESVKLAGLYQSGDPPRVDPNLIKQLKQNARGSVEFSTNASTDFASFVRVSKNGDRKSVV